MNKNQIIRLLFSLALTFAGVILLLLDSTGKVEEFISDIGLAFIVAGVFAMFSEGVLKFFDSEDAAEVGSFIANEVHKRLRESPLGAQGIRLVAPIRKGYDGYYGWVVSNGPQKLFFAGRSVLHRIDADFRARNIGSAEEVIRRRLSEGAKIRVMFIDPRSDIISRLAKEERQQESEMLSDIAYSIGICKRLHALLEATDIPASANLDIRVFDEIPYFAYHSVDDSMIVGFYFSSALGHSSAAYEVLDSQTRQFFEGHFESIFSRASGQAILDIDSHRRRIEMDKELVNSLQKSLNEKLGEEKTNALIGGQSRR